MWTRAAFLVGSLILASSGAASAQHTNILAGGGASFYSADLGEVNPHILGGVAFGLSPHLAARIDAFYLRGDEAFFGGNLDLVVLLGDSAASARPYLMAGGGIGLEAGEARAEVNAGVGLQIGAPGRMGFFVEGRVQRFFEVSYPYLLGLTAGVRIPIN